jgi:hypothetical protein
VAIKKLVLVFAQYTFDEDQQRFIDLIKGATTHGEAIKHYKDAKNFLRNLPPSKWTVELQKKLNDHEWKLGKADRRAFLQGQSPAPAQEPAPEKHRRRHTHKEAEVVESSDHEGLKKELEEVKEQLVEVVNKKKKESSDDDVAEVPEAFDELDDDPAPEKLRKHKGKNDGRTDKWYQKSDEASDEDEDQYFSDEYFNSYSESENADDENDLVKVQPRPTPEELEEARKRELGKKDEENKEEEQMDDMTRIKKAAQDKVDAVVANVKKGPKEKSMLDKIVHGVATAKKVVDTVSKAGGVVGKVAGMVINAGPVTKAVMAVLIWYQRGLSS